jgi:hypothetical protein
LWVWETAEAFWREAVDVEPFPRDLRGPIARALPVTVVLLPRLRVAAVDEWLDRNGAERAVAVPDRPLRGCLVARSDQGIIFLEGGDPEDEQRFSLAHELAHFLRDYREVRVRAVAKLGPAIRDVLDGERPPTREERLLGVLAGATVGFHVHLMDRAPRGPSAAIDRAERDADLLAFELLAPARHVLQGVEALGSEERRAALRRRLVADYGLPPAEAWRYAAVLVPEESADSLLKRLGLGVRSDE